MEPRLKDYDATGIAPNGRLFAGDLNLLQDSIPSLADLTQDFKTGTLTIGEDGLAFSRYGAAEMALAGALRVSGLLRGLGGIVPPTLTTAARNALAAGSRPYGMVIVNSTTNRLEFNAGTDVAPNWQPVIGIPGGAGTVLTSDGTSISWAAPAPGEQPGVIKDFAGQEANIPAGYLPCDGRILAQAVFPALFDAIADTWNTFAGQADPGAGNFRVPKLNGLFRLTKKDMGGQAPVAGAVSRAAAALMANKLGEEYHALTLAENGPHTHPDTISVAAQPHSHRAPIRVFVNFAPGGNEGAQDVDWSNGDRSTESVTVGTTKAGSVGSSGSGSAHENTPPSAIVNTIIKT